MVFYLRGPLKISENLGMATMFLSTLTPKFYVALTGTSSLISGLILIFEWWYYRRYGTSFIEQVSLNHISPWLGGGDPPETSTTSPPAVPECKVWRNPLNLFRGAEYQRFQKATKKEPLTYYDMNLSAQDHQTFFTCEADAGERRGLVETLTDRSLYFRQTRVRDHADSLAGAEPRGPYQGCQGCDWSEPRVCHRLHSPGRGGGEN